MVLFAPHCKTRGSGICVTDRSASDKTLWAAGPAPDTPCRGRSPVASWPATRTGCSWLRADGWFHRRPWARALPADVCTPDVPDFPALLPQLSMHCLPMCAPQMFRISQHFCPSLVYCICCLAGWSHSLQRTRPTIRQLREWATWTHRPQGRITSWTWAINTCHRITDGSGTKICTNGPMWQ